MEQEVFPSRGRGEVYLSQGSIVCLVCVCWSSVPPDGQGGDSVR